MIESPDLWAALLPVIDALETLGVPYHVGGSVASSFTVDPPTSTTRIRISESLTGDTRSTEGRTLKPQIIRGLPRNPPDFV